MLDRSTSPSAVEAQLLWFHHGYVEYRFPNRLHHGETVASLQLTMEVCSEAPLHNENWPSDVVVSINGVALGSWTSPGDFGDQRGAFTPEWWSTANTQYGLMKIWQVTGTPAPTSMVSHCPMRPSAKEPLPVTCSTFISPYWVLAVLHHSV